MKKKMKKFSAYLKLIIFKVLNLVLGIEYVFESYYDKESKEKN